MNKSSILKKYLTPIQFGLTLIFSFILLILFREIITELSIPRKLALYLLIFGLIYFITQIIFSIIKIISFYKDQHLGFLFLWVFYLIIIVFLLRVNFWLAMLYSGIFWHSAGE